MTDSRASHEAAEVDLVLLTRDDAPVRRDVWEAVQCQRGVAIRVQRVVGRPEQDDANRYDTIVRARNRVRGLASAPFVLLVDDDVVLGPGCAAALLDGLRRRPEFAALAADSAGEMDDGWQHWDYPAHVGMAAIMFRRRLLEMITFRWEPGRCECGCCCDDLRRLGYGVGYQRGAEARHRPAPAWCGDDARPAARRQPRPAAEGEAAAGAGRVLAAFDRRHARLFRHRFLGSLRACGNPEKVTAVAYGLRPSERRRLGMIPGVEVWRAEPDGHPARRRLRDFRQVLEGWPPDLPVAYWDSGDVLFQGRLAPLWDLVRAQPDRLLVAEEAATFHDGVLALAWIRTISDPDQRCRALDLVLGRPVLNSGFAAATVGAMSRYLREAERILDSPAVWGSTDWGDQTALNLFCYSNPERWRAIPDGWNYCLANRPPGQFRIGHDGRATRTDGGGLHVLHGAGGTLRPWDLAHLTGGISP